jgi:nicotinamidase-related amidase
MVESSQFVQPERAALVLIDVQPLFLNLMAGEREPLLARLEHLLLLARTFEMPVIATFEHPVERNGWLPERLERIFPPGGGRYVKRTFNLCSEPEIRAAVEATGREQMIVAGAETDVCVLQSVLGLLEMGRQVFLVEDGLFTAEPNDAPALRRMEQAGAIPLTCKTLYYELKRSVAVPSFHLEWNRQFGDGGSVYLDPYDLPPSRSD